MVMWNLFSLPWYIAYQPDDLLRLLPLECVQHHGHIASAAVPRLASCASSARARRLWAARHSWSEAQPVGSQPRPQLLELAASKVANFTSPRLTS